MKIISYGLSETIWFKDSTEAGCKSTCKSRSRKFLIKMGRHHSLKPWGFVIHGAIDSYFRQIVYLHCSTNYKKETVLKLFEEAITDYGAPSRIRTDKGGETTLIWELMTEIRG